MLIYFEFEDKRRRADVKWPKDDEDIIVHLTEKELVREFQEDLYYSVEEGNKVTFSPEDTANDRLTELQNLIRRRLQELIKKS